MQIEMFHAPVKDPLYCIGCGIIWCALAQEQRLCLRQSAFGRVHVTPCISGLPQKVLFRLLCSPWISSYLTRKRALYNDMNRCELPAAASVAVAVSS